MHTSLLTVAVLTKTQTDSIYMLRDSEHYRYEYFKSSGAGGQHRNKTESGVKCIHIPTNIKQERTLKCQHQNKRKALEAVNELLDQKVVEYNKADVNDQRQNKGSGERGSRSRTYKFQEGLVYNHTTKKTKRIKEIMKGNIHKLWE